MTITSPTSAVLTITDATFRQEVLDSDLPVLVDFWARWCPPCHMIAPVLEQLAAERAGSLRICSLDTEENPLTQRAYRVTSLPTLLLFRHGTPLRALIGARPKSKLTTELDTALTD